MSGEQATDRKTIVLIEDDRDISTTIQSVLTAAGYRAVSYTLLTLPKIFRVELPSCAVT